jgi:steroid 5-alpha reductase family enzyme
MLKNFNFLFDILNDYKDNELFFLSLKIAFGLSFSVWIVSIITKNVSIVDRLWSLLPVMYSWLFTLYPVIYQNEKINARLLLTSSLVSVWGFRLTYNFWRKGGFDWKFEHEDYRWEHVRKAVNNKVLFQIFNLTFISFYQNFLILGFTLPSFYMYKFRNNPLNLGDSVNTIAYIFFLTIEIIADQQQWYFQSEKYRLKAINKLEGDYKLGFIKNGLFKYSRHPNFFAELMLWWTFYAFSVSASNQLFNYSIIGAALLNLLFFGSTKLTENITLSKYPQYEIYQRNVSRLVPWFSKPDIKYN